MLMPNFAYVRVKSLKEAIQHLSSNGARIHAGGTDLLGCLRDDIFGAKKLVSLSQLNDLRGIRLTKDGGLRIGALTTITEVANNKMIQERYPALARLPPRSRAPSFATKERWVVISARSRDAGTTGESSIVCGKVEIGAMPTMAKTNFILFSEAAAFATLFTLLTLPPS